MKFKSYFVTEKAQFDTNTHTLKLTLMNALSYAHLCFYVPLACVI